MYRLLEQFAYSNDGHLSYGATCNSKMHTDIIRFKWTSSCQTYFTWSKKSSNRLDEEKSKDNSSVLQIRIR